MGPYRSERRALMLCPVCQSTDEVFINASVETYKRRYLATSVMLSCANCGTPSMFEIDDELLEPLKELHRHYIPTHSHCAVIHRGDNDETVYPKHDDWCRGPYIMFEKLRPDIRAKLEEAVSEHRSEVDSTAYDIILKDSTVPIYYEDKLVHFAEYVIMQVNPSKGSFNHMQAALDILQRIVYQWMAALDDAGIRYEEDKNRMHRIRLQNYRDPDAYWFHHNPFGEDSDDRDHEM